MGLTHDGGTRNEQGDGVREGKPVAVIHLDLDGATHIYRAHGWPYDRHDDQLFVSGLRHALDVFDQAGVRATLFVIAEDVDHRGKREALRDAVRRGHEIASHSLTHRSLTALPLDEKRREVFESRERLAAELKVHVGGFRAPGFDMDRATLELLAEAGYAFDSSLFPTARSAHRVGVSRVAATPHHPLGAHALLELPLPAYRPLPMPFHPSYSLVFGTWYFRLGLKRFRRTGAPFVLLFHLTDFADPLPRRQLPKWSAALFTLSYLSRQWKVRRCQEMLALVRRNYRLVSTGQLIASRSTTPGVI